MRNYNNKILLTNSSEYLFQYLTIFQQFARSHYQKLEIPLQVPYFHQYH